jgi:DNA-binding NtrC family response regulator
MLHKTNKVLVVDDEASVCEILKEDLTSLGYFCATANNAHQALSLLSAENFDAMLLDIRLPEISGVDFLKQINGIYPNIAVLMLSAVNDAGTIVETMKAGASDYITKPFELDHLEKCLLAALENKKQTKNCLTIVIPDASLAEIEALASGVEAKQDMLDVHSEKVTQQTVGLARTLGFPEEKIQKWVASRSEMQAKKVKQITDSICLLAQDPESKKPANN